MVAIELKKTLVLLAFVYYVAALALCQKERERERPHLLDFPLRNSA